MHKSSLLKSIFILFLYLLFYVTVGDKNIVLDTKYFSITYPDTNVATTEDPGLMFVKGMDLIYVDITFK